MSPPGWLSGLVITLALALLLTFLALRIGW